MNHTEKEEVSKWEKYNNMPSPNVGTKSITLYLLPLLNIDWDRESVHSNYNIRVLHELILFANNLFVM